MYKFYLVGFQGGVQYEVAKYLNKNSKKYNGQLCKFITNHDIDKIKNKKIKNKNIKIIYIKTHINNIIDNLESKSKISFIKAMEIWQDDFNNLKVGTNGDFKYIADLYIEQNNLTKKEIIYKINKFLDESNK